MKKSKQLFFWQAGSPAHGGATARGRRKTARLIVTKSPMHLTFKASRARWTWNLLRFERSIEEKIRHLGRRYRVRVYRTQNVGNHLHLLVQAASRRELQSFLRVLPQAVVFLVTGARKGHAVGRFWDGLVHSRVVRWGRDWRQVRRYLDKNQLEAAGAPRAAVDAWYLAARSAWDSG